MSTVRKIYKELARRSEAMSRQRFKLNVGSSFAKEPSIYLLCPDHNVPSGGIKVIYNHVDILNDAGMNAQVLHRSRGFRCDWFENRTRIANALDATLSRGDLIVVPEVDSDLLDRIPDDLGCIVFNQNSHLTWQRISAEPLLKQLRRPNVLGCLTVSEHNRQMLEYALPDIEIGRIHLGIDERTFHPRGGARANRVGYMPRRGREDASQVVEMLNARGALRGWEVLALDGLSHEQVAEALRSCKIFLAFTHQEGFGLPPAEAMACGTYVIGNHGHAGAEFFCDTFSQKIDCGDVMMFAKAVEEKIQRENLSPGWCGAKGAEASRFILEQYSADKEKAEVTEYYRNLISSLKDRNDDAHRMRVLSF